MNDMEKTLKQAEFIQQCLDFLHSSERKKITAVTFGGKDDEC